MYTLGHLSSWKVEKAFNFAFLGSSFNSFLENVSRIPDPNILRLRLLIMSL